MSGFHLRGGGGSIEPPKTEGGGFEKRAQLTGTTNQSSVIMNSGAEGGQIFVEH